MKRQSPQIARTEKRYDGERGQALVEFAFASFFVLTLLFGVIEFGRALFTYDLITADARLGSRWAMVRATTMTQATLQTYLRSVSNGIDTTQLTATPAFANSGICTTTYGTGCTVTVVVQYPFHFVWRFAPITMSSSSQMVISQ